MRATRGAVTLVDEECSEGFYLRWYCYAKVTQPDGQSKELPLEVTDGATSSQGGNEVGVNCFIKRH